MKVYIEGSDGCGKSTLVKSLIALGYDAYDRGGLTKTTLDGINRYKQGDIYIILNCPTEICRERLAAAGKDLNEVWHTEESINFYWKKFVKYSSMYKASFVDSRGSKETTLKNVLRIIKKKS